MVSLQAERDRATNEVIDRGLERLESPDVLGTLDGRLHAALQHMLQSAVSCSVDANNVVCLPQLENPDSLAVIALENNESPNLADEFSEPTPEQMRNGLQQRFPVEEKRKFGRKQRQPTQRSPEEYGQLLGKCVQGMAPLRVSAKAPMAVTGQKLFFKASVFDRNAGNDLAVAYYRPVLAVSMEQTITAAQLGHFLMHAVLVTQQPVRVFRRSAETGESAMQSMLDYSLMSEIAACHVGSIFGDAPGSHSSFERAQNKLNHLTRSHEVDPLQPMPYAVPTGIRKQLGKFSEAEMDNLLHDYMYLKGVEEKLS